FQITRQRFLQFFAADVFEALPQSRDRGNLFQRLQPWNEVLVMPSENLPFPSLAKRGENRTEKIPPLKKGDKGGFEFNFSGCHRLDFLNELLRRHTRSR